MSKGTVPQNEDKRIQMIRYQMAVIAASVLTLIPIVNILIIYFSFAPKDWAPWDRFSYSVKSFIVSSSSELVAAVLAFLVSYLWIVREFRKIETAELIRECLREGKSEITEYKTVWEAPWREAIESASFEVDICSQGWDSLVKRYSKDWKAFLEKGGRVNLFLPAEQSDTIHHIALRMGKSDDEQLTEIRKTYASLQELNAKGKGQVTPHYATRMIWYALVRFDKKVAFISSYEHERSEWTIKSPIYQINLDKSPETKAWTDKELEFLAKLPKPESQPTPKVSL